MSFEFRGVTMVALNFLEVVTINFDQLTSKKLNGATLTIA
jgi:hypothetical protein